MAGSEINTKGIIILISQILLEIYEERKVNVKMQLYSV